MIEQADWLLVGIIVAVAVALTYVVSSIYYVQRVFDIRRECVESQQQNNREIIELRNKLARRETRDRVLGSTSVGRLLDKEVD